MNLRYRIGIIKSMQIFGVAKLFGLCLVHVFVVCGSSAGGGLGLWGEPILLLISLALSLRELMVSIDALMFQISDLDEIEKP